MLKRLAVVVLFFGVLLATAKSGAKTYTFVINDKVVAGTTELRPGEYHVKLNGSEVAVTDQDGEQLAVAAKIETAEHKFELTSLHCSMDGGTNRLLSIELGGSTYKLVFQ